MGIAHLPPAQQRDGTADPAMKSTQDSSDRMRMEAPSCSDAGSRHRVVGPFAAAGLATRPGRDLTGVLGEPVFLVPPGVYFVQQFPEPHLSRCPRQHDSSTEWRSQVHVVVRLGRWGADRHTPAAILRARRAGRASATRVLQVPGHRDRRPSAWNSITQLPWANSDRGRSARTSTRTAASRRLPCHIATQPPWTTAR
jgi:hypothetical protein